MWRNGVDRFGRVTRGLHWIIAFGVIGMLGFGLYLSRMEVNLSTYGLFALHKSIGITLLLAVIIRLIWHRITPPPGPIDTVPAWQMSAARSAHTGLYALLMIVPLTGWIASAASGLDVVIWGITLPRIAPVSEGWESGFFAAHWVTTKLLAALIILHVAGAFHRRDGTLARMVRGR